MFIQIADDTYLNLAHVARIQRQTSEQQGNSFAFYSASNVLLAQIEWGSDFNHDAERALMKYGLAPAGHPGIGVLT